MEKNIYQKLEEARKLIRESSEKPEGHNSFSKYNYFSPSQVEKLVSEVCEKVKVTTHCNLLKDKYGLYQTLDFINLDDPKEFIHFELRTQKGSITATSDTQQMGGTDTYSERYIKMKAFQIKDNNLDPDSQDNRGSVKKDIPLDEDIPLEENSLNSPVDNELDL